MGKITNMQKNQNDINLSYVRNKSKQRKIAKPRLRVENGKDILTLLGPNAHRYRLSPNQKRFQQTGRLTIAAIAVALGITAVGAFANTHTEPTNNTEVSTISVTDLEKNEALDKAEEKLLDIIYQDLDSFKENAYVEYSHNEEMDSDTITVYEEQNYQKNGPQPKFTYTRFNNKLDDFLVSNKNNSEIAEWLDSIIDTYNDKNISKENLRILNSTTLNLNAKKFKLDGKNIVGISERESGIER